MKWAVSIMAFFAILIPVLSKNSELVSREFPVQASITNSTSFQTRLISLNQQFISRGLSENKNPAPGTNPILSINDSDSARAKSFEMGSDIKTGGLLSTPNYILGIEPPPELYNIALNNYVIPSSGTINYGEAFTVSTNIINNGTNSFNGDYSVAVFDNSYKFIDFVEIKTGYVLTAGSTYSTNLIFSTSGIFSMVPGTYYAGIFYKPTNANWIQVQNNGGYTNLVPIIIINPNDIQLNSPITITPGLTLTHGRLVSVNLNIINNGTSTFTGQYRAGLLYPDGTLAETIAIINENNGLLPGQTYPSPFLTFGASSVTANPGTYLLAVHYKTTSGNWQFAGSTHYPNPIQVTVQAAPIPPDQYEINNTIAQSYNLPITYIDNISTINTTGSNFNTGTDIDYYKIILPAGSSYAVSARIHDSKNSGNGIVYTVDAKFSYTTDGYTWSDPYDDVMGDNIILNNGGTVYFVLSPYFTGSTGTYLLAMSITRTPPVGTPVFTLGAASVRCQGNAIVTYAASATNTTGIAYALDAASLTGGNSINAATGAVTYEGTWSGTSIITAIASGYNGPATAAHTVTTTPSVDIPVFSLGATSSRNQGAETVTYTAIANHTTGITYVLDPASITAGNGIITGTGQVTYTSGWSGISVITASAAGCNGPATAIHTVTTASTAVGTPVFTLGATSVRCQGSGIVTYTADAVNTTGITYSLDETSLSDGNSINSSSGAVTYTGTWSGISFITASAAGYNGPVTAVHSVTVTPTVGIPVFSSGATSQRNQGAETVTYTATAANNTNITFTLDATSIIAGNSINAGTGAVTYTADWSGTSIITASAAGCNGPATAIHTVTTSATPGVGTPVFILGATSTRCQGAGSVTYTANAANTTGITYTLDPVSLSAGNSIDPATGEVTYPANWSGITIITASAAGLNGPVTSTHTDTITPSVGIPVFSLGPSSSRNQGAETVPYTALANNTTGLTYSLDATSLAAGNNIDAIGTVTYTANWSGISVINATAAGCNGPSTAIHTVTTAASTGVSTPVFTLGATSTRCQGTGSVIYNANAFNTSGITYLLDPASLSGGNSINTNSGEVTYSENWSGISIITASAAGYNGPTMATHTVTIISTVGEPVFSLGVATARNQGAETVTYTATATNTTGIIYTLDAASEAAGNSIDAGTGTVTYSADWIGISVITASAAGCNGPVTANHTVTTTGVVGVNTPVFILGISSVRCQGSDTIIYTANTASTTQITYTLDNISLNAGNSINPATGEVIFSGNWNGTTIITASSNGVIAPTTAIHTVTTTPAVSMPVFVRGDSSSRFQRADSVTYTAAAANSTGIIYTLDTASLTAGNTINGITGTVTYTATWRGISIITALATGGCGDSSTMSHTATTIATTGVTTPVFTLGAVSERCQGAGTVTYTANADSTTGITYSLDAISLTGGNSINATTGVLSFVNSWSGTSIITASAAGYNGPAIATHTVTTTQGVGIPAFILGDASTRDQGAETIYYVTLAANATGISYTLDTVSLNAGNSINSISGSVTYTADWNGITVITATAAGCNGPATAIHTVTTSRKAGVGTPVFTLGAASVRCQGAETIIYTAKADSTTGITYVLDSTSLTGGNSINVSTGAVTYSGNWSGKSIITASAAGYLGPATATHSVTTTPSVGIPVFLLGTTETRNQGAGTTIYTAIATHATGIAYRLDTASISAGNSVNDSSGAVTFTEEWNGTTKITASAEGCNGPTIAIFTVKIASVTGLGEAELPGLIRIYPNPAKNFISIDLNEFNGMVYQVEVINTQGQHLIEYTNEEYDKSFEFPLENFSEGLYFMKLLTDTGILTRVFLIIK